MKPDAPRRPRGAAPAALLALALARCSSTPTPAVTNPTPPTPPRPAEAPPDLSAVPAPPTLLVTVRMPSPRGFARRLGERVGLSELVQGLEEQLPEVFNGDAELARAVDLDAPADVVVYQGPRGRVRAVIAFGSVPMPRAEDALSRGHRLTPVSNGVRRIERAREGSEESSGGATECVLAPMAGADRGARIVCSDRYDYIADAVAYLTRTLPRSPASPNDGDVQVEVAAEQLRGALADDAQELANQLPEAITPRPDPANPALQDQVRTYAREHLARTLTQGLQDLSAAKLSLRFIDGAATLHGEVGFRALGAPLVQRLVAAMRESRPSADILNRMPPNAATYGVGGGAMEPLRPELDLAGPVLARVMVPNAALPAADAAALRTALTNAFRNGGFNRFQSSTAMGTGAGGAEWHLASYQLDAPAAPFVANARALFAALRRPAVARAINAEWHVNPATLRTPPAAGLPAGSLLVQLPVPATLPRATRDLLRIGTAATYEMLFVPEGNTLWLAYGADPRARYREARANHPAPVEIAGLSDAGVALAGAAFPRGLASLLARIDPQIGRTVERALQASPGAAAPLTGFVRHRAEGEGVVLTGDLRIPDGVLGAIGGSFRQSP